MGIRNTFEARIHRLGSYISSVHLGNNIMYPNCFFLHREALDYKTPLLRFTGMDATDVCKYFDKM
jgi:glutamine synthetase type III